MRAVNLLPHDEHVRRRRVPSTPIVLAGLAPVVLVGLLAGGFVLESGKVEDKRTALAALERELALIPAPVPADPANAALTEEKNKRITALSDVLSRRVAFDRVLREISLVLPEDVWLASLVARTPQALAQTGATPTAPSQPAGDPAQAAPAAQPTSPPPTGAPAAPSGTESAGFVLTGYTYSQEGVARLLSRLAVIPHLANVRLQRSARVPVAKRAIVEFTIVADLRPAKVAA